MVAWWSLCCWARDPGLVNSTFLLSRCAIYSVRRCSYVAGDESARASCPSGAKLSYYGKYHLILNSKLEAIVGNCRNKRRFVIRFIQTIFCLEPKFAQWFPCFASYEVDAAHLLDGAREAGHCLMVLMALRGMAH